MVVEGRARVIDREMSESIASEYTSDLRSGFNFSKGSAGAKFSGIMKEDLMYEKCIASLNTAIADEIAAIHQYMYFHFRVKPARAKPGNSDGRVGGGWPRQRTASVIRVRKRRPWTATAVGRQQTPRVRVRWNEVLGRNGLRRRSPDAIPEAVVLERNR